MTNHVRNLTHHLVIIQNFSTYSFLFLIFIFLSGCNSEKKAKQLTEEEIIKMDNQLLTMSYDEALSAGYIWFFDKDDNNKYKFTVLEEFKAKKGGAEGILSTLLREYDNTLRVSIFSQAPLLTGKDYVQNTKYGVYEIIDLQSLISPSENPLTTEVELDSTAKVFRINGYDYSTKFSDGSAWKFALPSLNGMSIFFIKSLTNDNIVISASQKYKGDIFTRLNAADAENRTVTRQQRVNNISFTFSGSENALLVSTDKIDMGDGYDTATNKHFRYIEFDEFNLSLNSVSQQGKIKFFADSDSQTSEDLDIAIINNNPQKFFGPAQEEIMSYAHLYLGKRDSITTDDTIFFIIGAKKQK